MLGIERLLQNSPIVIRHFTPKGRFNGLSHKRSAESIRKVETIFSTYGIFDPNRFFSRKLTKTILGFSGFGGPRKMTGNFQEMPWYIQQDLQKRVPDQISFHPRLGHDWK